MRGFWVFILTLIISCNSTITDQGFYHKAEAKNEMVNGVKEGKWVEYLDSTYRITKDTNSPFFRLVIYNTGKPIGIARDYLKNGKLMLELPYVNGKPNGVEKTYYESGKLESEIPLVDGKANGVEKTYYEKGTIEFEYPFTNGKENGVEKWYGDNGKLWRETTYVNGVANAIKDYDSTGHEIK